MDTNIGVSQNWGALGPPVGTGAGLNPYKQALPPRVLPFLITVSRTRYDRMEIRRKKSGSSRPVFQDHSKSSEVTRPQGRNFRPKSGSTATRSVAKPNRGLSSH